jgi:hypothetical protein
MTSMVFVAGFVVACGVLVVGVYLFARSDELNPAHAARARPRHGAAPDAVAAPAPGAPGYPAEAREVTRAATGPAPSPLAGR